MARIDQSLADPAARRRWPLRFQILFPFTTVIVGVIAGASTLEAWFAAQSSRDETLSKLRNLTHALSRANYPLTEPVLRQVKQLSGADLVRTDPRGRVTVSTMPGLEKVSGAEHLGKPSAPAESFELGRPIELSGKSFFHYAVKLQAAPGSVSPVLHILYPVEEWRRAQWRAALPPLYVGGFALLAVIILSVVIGERIARPIVQLRNEVNRLVEGNFQPVPMPRSNDELADLVRDVNTLAERLEDYRMAVQRSERLAALGQLSAGLAHQVRNAVAGARIAIQLHHKGCSDTDRESLEVALRQLTLSEDHLKSVLTAGQQQPLKRDDVSMRELVKDVAALLEPTCRHRRVRLTTVVTGDEEHVQADPDQLRQALMNLVLNAVEAAGSGGWVRIHLVGSEQRLAVVISDSGPGPPDELRDQMYEPLATGKPTGIGLGLSVAKQVAEAHGGSLTFSREEATRFELSLPRCSAAAKTAAAITDKALMGSS